MSRKARSPNTAEIYSILEAFFPDAHCELTHQGPFQLLIATILSAQCTDVQVNKVTTKLFKQYPDAQALASAPLEKVMELVRSTGFYKNKAKNIIACAQGIEEQFQGEIPQSIEELITLPGVGRKTANVLLGNAFGINHGVVVDTHVKRISRLLGLTKEETPEKIEQDLMKLFERKNWCQLSHLFIFLGRRICIARRPKCSECPLNKLCPSAQL